MSDVVCRLARVVKDFPGQRALDLDEIELLGGEVHALVGQNGAGKSTLVKILAGAERPSSGTIELGGKTVELTPPAHARRLGIAPIFQEMAVVPAASGYENANLGLPYPRWGPFIRWRALRERTESAGASLGLTPDVLRRVGRDLSVAELQMVAICRGLLQDARLVLLDEPTASLTEREVQRLYDVIRELSANGVTILYISHRLDEIRDIAHRVTVLRDGRRIATLPANTPRAEIVQLITGGVAESASPAASRDVPSTAALEASHLRGANGVEISVSLHSGEIVGLAGLVGSGRTSMARLLAGLEPPSAGKLRLANSDQRIASPREAVRSGIVFVPEDRRRQALIIGQSVGFNITLASLHRFRWLWALIDRQRERKAAREFVERLGIRTRGVDQPVWQLSGGNQQKAVLARWMLRGARVFIVDEPTVGLDVAARAEVHAVLRELAKQGAAVLFISSDLDEMSLVADRALVVRGGRVVAHLPKSRLSKTEILRYCYEVGEAA